MIPRRNDLGSTESVNTSPSNSPRISLQKPISEPVTSISTENTEKSTTIDKPLPPDPPIKTAQEEEEELPIPPEFIDHYADVKVKWNKMDDEPLIYRDKFIAITKTYLYIFNYYIPDGREKAIPMTSINNVQTDEEAKISDLAHQKWGAGSIDLWWAKDFGRWKGHDLCIIVTVDHGLVKRKGFTLENNEGLYVLKKAWKTAKDKMLQKFFRTKPTNKDVEDSNTRALLEADSWSPPAFSSNQIRVILCQDTGDKAKLTLYDSAVPVTSNSSEDRRPTSELSSSWSGVGFFLPKSSSAINIKSNNPVITTGHPPSHHRNHHHHNKLDGDNIRKSFDSINKSSIKTLPPSINRNGHAFTSQRKTAHNIDLIGEMMFGAVPLSYKGMTTKIHYIKSPKPQILLTKLFSISPADFESISPGRRSSFSSMSSDTSVSSSTQGSLAINNELRNVTRQKFGSNPIHFDDYSESSDDDSFRFIPNYSTSPSFFHPGPPILGLRTNDVSVYSTSSLSTSPRNNFTNRRMRRYSQTSMENGIFNPTPLPGSIARLESLTNRLDPLNNNNLSLKHPSRSMMYAIGVVITLENNTTLEEFIFSHFALLENRLHQLHSTAFRLLCHFLKKSSPSSSINGPNSIFNPTNRRFSVASLSPLMLQNEQIWLDAVFRFKTSFYQLYNTPRIQEPLWLNMSTFPQQRSKLAKSLLNELTFLLENFDKESNLYPLLKNKLTTVLMYHLAWVPTVAPIADFEERNGKNLFYDPLWAQLGDLYGSIGSPSIMSRTIIVGTDVNIVRRILFVLSYFIRCNEVYERMEHMVPTESQSEEQVDPENNLRYNISSKDFSSEDISNSNSLDMNNSYHATDNRRKSVNLDLSFDNFTDNLLEVPMPRSQTPTIIPDVSSNETRNENDETSSEKLPYRADELFVKSYGRSLMVGCCDTYMSDFVLMGLPKLGEFQESLESDLRNSLLVKIFFYLNIILKLIGMFRQNDAAAFFSRPSFKIRLHFGTVEYIASCDAYGSRHVIGNSTVTVDGDHIRNGGGYFLPLHTSNYIYAMLHQCKDLYTTMGMPAESCLEYIEDHLRLLYYKAVMYKKLYSSSLPTSTTSGTSPSIASPSIYMPPSSVDHVPLDILDVIGLQKSDIPLVKAINSTF
ncbi:6237_t:CDS:10 [Funneliformis geosporum]|uniref:16068_t:CDS:1 n=1 Tax=Funneliformis geosporum TaxID=1117311 RepID=A0A9W4WR67_9GLOM|nr:6237_t:CDS:10 [Funneliformis geosporum]CAI2172833.1 16068_t:CDS:10 [Funneliformis geosporum]